MTIFKDPENTNYIFYGVIIILAIIGSLFWGEPAKSENLSLLHKHDSKGETSNAWKPIMCENPKSITDLLSNMGEDPLMTMQNISVGEKGQLIKTVIAFGMNKETGTWSLVEFLNNDWACIIGNGKGANVVNNKKDIRVKNDY